MILRSMMRRVVAEEEERKSKELTPVSEEASVLEKDLSVVKRFGGLTFDSPEGKKQSTLKKDQRLGITPLIGLIEEMKLISTEKKIKDDFDLLGKEREEDDLVWRDMEERYEKVA